MNLKDIGYSQFFKDNFEKLCKNEYFPARIINEQKGRYRIITENGEMPATLTGKMRHITENKADLPTVGDWIAAVDIGDGNCVIQELLPRKSKFSRSVSPSGRKDDSFSAKEQVVAANIDTVFIVSGLDRDHNISRIERYLTIAWNSGATPVVVLNKADIVDDAEDKRDEVETALIGSEVAVISAKNNITEIEKHLVKGKTIALLGSSGAGKSTLINRILGFDQQKTAEVSKTIGKGRHTTTSKELFISDSGLILIDTPGMREIQPWLEDLYDMKRFEKIEELALLCRFADCKHETEPQCAVKDAVENGTISQHELENYRKWKKELEFAAAKETKTTRQREKEWYKSVVLPELKQMKKRK